MDVGEPSRTASDAILTLSGVSILFSGRPALRSIDWHVRRGERWVVLGPNGSGKTTLLGVVGGQRLPSRGLVRVLGERVGRVDLRELRKRIGLVSPAQASRFRSELTVLGAVWTGARATLGEFDEPLPEELDRARALLTMMGCGSLEGRRLTTLSEGERVRVQVARSLMPDPPLLLLDEPAANLDLPGREMLLRHLAGVSAGAIVLVTHRVEEIPADFTHALLLREGAVVACGPLEEALTAASLSECFGLSLRLAREDGRYTAWAGPTPSQSHARS